MHLRRALHIAADAFVLEIGGGSLPDPRSQVLVDRFPDADGIAQRGGGPLVLGGRPLIQADGRRLPFKDGCFDYVIASHVIEHLEPTGAVDLATELCRVATAGYVEAPSIVYELVRDIPEHRIVVYCGPEGIHVAPKPPRNLAQAFVDPLFYDPDFCWVVEKHNELFFTGIEWRSDVRVTSHGDWRDLLDFYSGEWAEATVKAGAAKSDALRRLRRESRALAKRYLPSGVVRLITQLRDRAWERHLSVRTPAMRQQEALDLVVCPSCHSRLQTDERERGLTCVHCGARFAVRPDGIPSLLV